MNVFLRVFLVAVLFAGPVLSEEVNCYKREQYVNHLAAKFQESRHFLGLNEKSFLVEVYASKESGTWTLTVTRPDGTICPVAHGFAFEKFSPE